MRKLRGFGDWSYDEVPTQSYGPVDSPTVEPGGSEVYYSPGLDPNWPNEATKPYVTGYVAPGGTPGGLPAPSNVTGSIINAIAQLGTKAMEVFGRGTPSTVTPQGTLFKPSTSNIAGIPTNFLMYAGIGMVAWMSLRKKKGGRRRR